MKDSTLINVLVLTIIGLFVTFIISSLNWKAKVCEYEQAVLIINRDTALQYINARDYQIEIVEDSILLFDGNRLVGTLPFTDYKTPLDSLIMEDNH